jgi:hypothetical protein
MQKTMGAGAAIVDHVRDVISAATPTIRLTRRQSREWERPVPMEAPALSLA